MSERPGMEVMTAAALEKALTRIVGVEHIAPDDQLAQYAVDGVPPRAAVFPSDAAQVAEVMRLASAEGLAVVPRGGGTAMALGNPPRRLDIVLGTRRMGRILEYEPADLTATVEAGITLGELDAALARNGQTLPIDAPRAERATIGGVLAANASGPRRLAYGTARDRVIGLRVVDALGTVIKGGGKVVKNVAGYDLPKLFIGSLGTLGIITEATFKLAPVPKARGTVLGGFRGLPEALETAQMMLRGGMRPTALELLNACAYDLIATRAGLPTLSDRSYFVAVDLGSVPAAVESQTGQAHRIVTQAGGKSLVVDDQAACDDLWRALVDLDRSALPGRDGPASLVTRSSVLFSQLERLVHGHEALAESSHLEVGLGAHLSVGVLRATWWGEGGGPANEAMLVGAVSTLRKATANVGGAFFVESCGSSMKRAVDVWGPPGPELAVMKRLKEQFDPGGVLSPGRFVGGL